MKILHLSFSDKNGGAAIAAYRLNEEMNKFGLDSKMLVLDKETFNITVDSISKKKSKIYHVFLFYLSFYFKKYILKSVDSFSLSLFGLRVSHLLALRETDVIYIHWVNKNFLSISEIQNILKLGKPVVLFLHDMWLITGGCHHSYECKKYESFCDQCPNIHNKYLKNVSSILFNKKKQIAIYNNFHIVCPSIWLTNCVKNSSIFQKRPIATIPNILNKEIFKNINKSLARSILNFPQDKKLLLFAANGGIKNPYKGWEYLLKSLQYLDEPNLIIIVLGDVLSYNLSQSIKYPVISLGKLSDEYSLALVYNAADIFVSPSLADNYPNTILESLSCHTPVAAFEVGGIPDLIEHKITGYLAKYKNDLDLANGIKWILENSNNNLFMNKLAESVEKKINLNTILNKHLNLLNSMMVNSK